LAKEEALPKEEAPAKAAEAAEPAPKKKRTRKKAGDTPAKTE
jgi:hypothetical protein